MLGRIRSLTGNGAAALECHGRCRCIQIDGTAAFIFGRDRELRLSVGAWHAAFAVREHIGNHVRRSLQIFDAAGQAVHKVYLTDQSDRAAFDTLVLSLASADRPLAFSTSPPPRHGAAPLARPVSRDAGCRVLTAAAAQAVPVTIMVANDGAQQSHTGIVARIMAVGPWLCAIGPDFALRLHQDRIEGAWMTDHGPACRGGAQAILLHDHAGAVIASISGVRGSAGWQDPAWLGLCAAVPDR
jgi:putative hemin transport protein